MDVQCDNCGLQAPWGGGGLCEPCLLTRAKTRWGSKLDAVVYGRLGQDMLGVYSLEDILLTQDGECARCKQEIGPHEPITEVGIYAIAHRDGCSRECVACGLRTTDGRKFRSGGDLCSDCRRLEALFQGANPMTEERMARYLRWRSRRG